MRFLLGALAIGLLVLAALTPWGAIANSRARAPRPMLAPSASAVIPEVDVESLPKARMLAPVEECPF